MTSGTILLATDLSCRCDRALDRATMLAHEWQAKMIVLHVLQQPEPVLELSPGTESPDPLQAARRRVREDTEYGEVSALLQEMANTRGVELVVLGTEGRSAPAQMLLGSVAQDVLDRLSVDVLVVSRRRN